jgi:hypothetical protein
MIRADPEMRYSANELMNDSWVISGPLITGKSYCSNTNIKTMLSKSLIGLHQIVDNSKRPSTGANLISARSGGNTMRASTDRLGSMTQYNGFGKLDYKPYSNDKETDAKSNSVGVRLQGQFTKGDKIKTFSDNFERATKEDSPAKSYFKSSMKSSFKRYTSSNRNLKHIMFKEHTNEDSYCFNQVSKITCKYPKNTPRSKPQKQDIKNKNVLNTISHPNVEYDTLLVSNSASLLKKKDNYKYTLYHERFIGTVSIPILTL